MLLYFVGYAKDKERISEKELFTQTIFYKYKLSSLFQMYSIYEIINTVFPNKYVPWELASVPPYYWDSEENIRFASKWFYSKLYDNEIIQYDDEILEIREFGSLFKLFKLDGLYYSKFDSSHFLFWNYLFPNKWFEWEFQITKKHFWESKENRIKALKQLIEERLNLSLDELPNKFNYPFLVKEYRKFSAICDTYYSSNLLLWLDECYPNYFNKEDFYNTIAKDGTKLDSIDEKNIHNLFFDNGLDIQYFENKQEAMKNFHNEDKKEFYVPDWIINDIIIEYFGWYNERVYGKYKTITNYMDKANRKVTYFSNLNNYNFIALYPKDLENNFQGIIEKFSEYDIKLVV